MRPKRQYQTLPKSQWLRDAGFRRYGWRGIGDYFLPVLFYAAPQTLLVRGWAVSGDPSIYVPMAVGYTILFVIFIVIARPMKWRPGDSDG